MEAKYIRIGSWDQAALRTKFCTSMCPVQTQSVFQVLKHMQQGTALIRCSFFSVLFGI